MEKSQAFNKYYFETFYCSDILRFYSIFQWKETVEIKLSLFGLKRFGKK